MAENKVSQRFPRSPPSPHSTLTIIPGWTWHCANTGLCLRATPSDQFQLQTHLLTHISHICFSPTTKQDMEVEEKASPTSADTFQCELSSCVLRTAWSTHLQFDSQRKSGDVRTDVVKSFIIILVLLVSMWPLFHQFCSVTNEKHGTGSTSSCLFDFKRTVRVMHQAGVRFRQWSVMTNSKSIQLQAADRRLSLSQLLVETWTVQHRDRIQSINESLLTIVWTRHDSAMSKRSQGESKTKSRDSSRKHR